MDYSKLDWQKIFNKPVCQLDGNGIFIFETTADLDVYAKDGSYLIPAGCVEAEIPEQRKNQVAQWQPESQTWHYLPDYRGKTAYDTATGNSITIDFVGDLPENLTLQAPPSAYHIWHNGTWQLDESAQQQAIQAEFQAAKNAKIAELNQAAQNFIARSAGTDKVPEFEVQSWALQAIEAKAWAIDKNAATPVLDKIAAARGVPADALKQAALRKTLQYEALTAFVAGQRQALQTQIEQADSLQALDAIVIDFRLPESE